MRPNYLFFDADDTLFDFKRSEREAINVVLREHGLPLTPEVLDKYSTINLQLWKALERNEVTREELFSLRFTRLIDYIHKEHVWHSEWGLDEYDWDAVDGMHFNEQFLNALGQQHFLLPDAEAVIQDLAGDYKLALVTNGVGHVQKSRLAASPIGDCFEALFISEELGIEKPDARFFDLACEALEIEDRQEILVIGDSLTADIKGANNAGIRSCWFNPYNQHHPEGDGSAQPDYTIQSLRELAALLSII